MADTNTQALTTPRQVKLKQCLIFSPSFAGRSINGSNPEEQGVDITASVLGINIYESIFDNTISGQVEIRETSAFPELFPFVGVEVLFLRFSVDYLGEEVEFTRA